MLLLIYVEGHRHAGTHVPADHDPVRMKKAVLRMVKNTRRTQLVHGMAF